VPATVAPGFAAAAALGARLDGRAAVAVTAAPVEPIVDDLLELAASLSVPVALVVWSDEGAVGSSDDQEARLRAAWSAGESSRVDVPVDLGATRVLTDVAGPVVAWTDR
jgi:hypothetical protein